MLCVAALALVTLPMTAPATAGSLKGRVSVATSPRVQGASMNPYPGTLGALEQAPEDATRRSDPRDVVVYLTGAAAPAVEARPENPRLYQINQNFEPHVLAVPVGTAVDFPNRDMILHNVFSYSKTKRFDLGYFGKDKSKSVVFDKPGLVKVFCDIHSNMSAFILVVDTPLVVQPTAAGNFELPDVPDGEYTLTIWHPTRGESTRTVSVDGDTTIELNL
jgi:plastocyanin